MSRKNYKVDEVIRQLSHKGVIITGAEPVTAKLKYIDQKIKNGELVDIVEEGKSKLEPYAIYLNNARDLGNGSWGKFDFLTKYMGYRFGGLGVYSKRMQLERN